MSETDVVRSNGHYHGGAAQLLARLEEPRTAEALNRLLDHAELLAFSVTALDGLLRRGEQIADNMASGVQELRRSMPETMDVDTAQLLTLAKQLPQIVEVTNRLLEVSARPEFDATLTMLSSPQTLTSLNRLLSHMDMLVFMIDSLDALLRRGEDFTENVRTSLRDVAATIPPDTDVISLLDTFTRFLPYLPRLVVVAPKFIEIIERLEPFVASSEFDALLASGVFHPASVSMVGRAGDAFVESYEESRRTNQRLGAFGLLRALGDPDVQRAAALVVAFGRRFGQSVHD